MGKAHSTLAKKLRGKSSSKDDPKSSSNGKRSQEDTTDSGNISPRPLPSAPSRKRVKALYRFDGGNDDDLPFKKGDIMELDGDTQDTEGWWLAIHCKTKKRGYIPSNYVIEDDASPKSQDWFFDYDRHQTDKMLLQPGNKTGTFLIRESKDKDSYVLSVRYVDGNSQEPSVKHYRIREKDAGGYFISPKISFESLIDLIDHYKESHDGLCCRLSQPCPRIKPVVAFRELETNRNTVKLMERLGAGCFGEVWKGKLRKVVDVAVKTLKKDGYTMTTEQFLNEAKIMHKLSHPRLVQLLAVVSAQEPFWIITELMVHGALLDFLRLESSKKLTFNNLIVMCTQIAEGMAYLESVNFIHRDLRAANVLVGEHYEVKVADFGLARIVEGDEYVSNESRFPVKWTAPEALMYCKFSVKSDVWSFGVLMYEIITLGKVPYPGIHSGEVKDMLERGERMRISKNGPIEVPASYEQKMLDCWKQAPEERPTFESLYYFFDDFDVSTEKKYDDCP